MFWRAAVRRCRGENRRAGRLDDGADHVLLPERARGAVSLMCATAHERRCRAWDAAAMARTAALRAPHRGDGAGARAVEAETAWTLAGRGHSPAPTLPIAATMSTMVAKALGANTVFGLLIKAIPASRDDIRKAQGKRTKAESDCLTAYVRRLDECRVLYYPPLRGLNQTTGRASAPRLWGSRGFPRWSAGLRSSPQRSSR